MTTRTKRRGRTLAAILAAMLMASVLSVVASGPAQAANTSGEELIDTNSDGIGDTRQFAGTHRYNTAVALATRFAEDNGGVTTVIIASGETQVDAVTAAGLAGNLDAAVLLTRSSRLPHNVARYIDEYNVTNVIVVGGTASVSDDVVTAIEALGSDPDVERVSGADRHATAAAVGNRLGGPNPTWCGSDQSAAILVNGGDAGRADAVAIGPLAYALGLPVLTTTADELPQATEDFLVDNKVERVVIVGGTSAVSAGIEDSLVEDVGVVNTQRISGGSAAATSVDIAQEMLGNCADVLGTNKDLVALVNRDAVADGISSAPLLGRGLGGGSPVPILLVGDELPAAVSDYLSGTAESRAGTKTHLSILAIGGTAVVSDAVMADAKAAAKTSGDITATITASKYTVADAVTAAIPAGKSVGDYKNSFTVSFSDPVADASISDPTLYRINGRRLEALDDASTDPVNEESLAANHRIDVANGIATVTLVHALEEGDTITVVGGAQVARALNGDRRPLQEASETLGAVTTASDRSAPRIEIIAVAGTGTFDVLVHESNPLYNELTVATNLSDFLTVRGASIPASTSDADPPVRTPRTDRMVTVAQGTDPTEIGRSGSGIVRLRFTATAAVTATSPNQTLDATGLIPGDVITVNRNAVRDDDGRSNALTRHTVRALRDPGKFEVSSVSIGNVRHGNLDGSGHAMATIGDETAGMTVKAKAGGDAAGAQGNGWKIYGYDDRTDGAANVYEWDIRVGVDVANRVISYTIFSKPAVPGFEKVAAAAPNLGNLADRLAAEDDFSAHFSLDFVRDADGATTQSRSTELGATSSAGLTFEGGTSAVGVVVRFNDNVETLLNDGVDLAYEIAADFDASLTATAGDDGLTVTFGAPDSQVHISYTSAMMRNLPNRSEFRVIAAGVATSYGAVDGTDTTSIREILNSLRPDSSITP